MGEPNPQNSTPLQPILSASDLNAFNDLFVSFSEKTRKRRGNNRD